MRIPLLKRELITIQEICEKNKIIISKINKRKEVYEEEFDPFMDEIKKNEVPLSDESKYQNFYYLIKDLYENQEKEKFLESKEHS